MSFRVTLFIFYFTILFVQSATWTTWGGDTSNTRNAQGNIAINTNNVGNLTLLWGIETLGAITTTPTLDENNIYTVDWLGGIYSINRLNGKLNWSQNISLLLNLSVTARAAVAISDDYLVSGIYSYLNTNENVTTGHAPPIAFGLNKTNGNLIWSTLVHEHPWAALLASPIIYQNKVFLGTSNRENSVARDPTYPCCTCRSAQIILNLTTGEILYRHYMVPDNNNQQGGYAGGSIWGSSFPIDTKRNVFYYGTGQLYSITKQVTECFNDPTIDNSTCISQDTHFDSIVAASLEDGAIQWSWRATPIDNWNDGCQDPILPDRCYNPIGNDYDFAMAPIFIRGNETTPDMLIASAKSGVAWGLAILDDPQTNQSKFQVKWSSIIGPGFRSGGGSAWGGAYDGKNYYVPLINYQQLNFTLRPSNITWNAGAWSALDPYTGNFLWQIPTTSDEVPKDSASGALTSSNGIVFGCSYSAGQYFAFDGLTGKMLWKFDPKLQTKCFSGPAIVDGIVYWGNGYPARWGDPGSRGHLFAFSLP